MFYIPVQFSKSFPLSFRTARWLSHLVSPLSTCFFTNFSGWLLPSHSVHSKISSLFSRLISCQSSPTARLYYLMPYLLASVIFWSYYTCMHVFRRLTFGFWLIYHSLLVTIVNPVTENFSEFLYLFWSETNLLIFVVEKLTILWLEIYLITFLETATTLLEPVRRSPQRYQKCTIICHTL